MIERSIKKIGMIVGLVAFNQCALAETISLSNPEQTYLQKSGRQLQYKGEHFPIIEVSSVYELGKLTALNFIDWVAQHPEGVVALPTGKTPELFIKFLNYYKQQWATPSVQADLNSHGIHLTAFPDTTQLKFVQLDEFYPIQADHKNSFGQYVKSYYLKILNIKPENALLIDIAEKGVLKERGVDAVFPDGKADLSLLTRKALDAKEALQQKALKEAQAFCEAYEKKIQALGGIGFFLGGVGYDGHVAFNLPGSTRQSTTRLVKLNYPTSAQSAVDLGGMAYSRNKLAISVGLKTISQNQNATILLTSAGEVKAPIIAQSIESRPNHELPITLLQEHPQVTFYLTKGAASELKYRIADNIKAVQSGFENSPVVQNALIKICIARNKSLKQISTEDLKHFVEGQAILAHPNIDLKHLATVTRETLEQKIEDSFQVGFSKTILHTAPHHDDVMLSYYGYMPTLMQNSRNTFSYVTSGFNSVTDQYIMQNLKSLLAESLQDLEKGVFQASYASSVTKFAKKPYPDNLAYLDTMDAYILGQRLKEIYSLKNAMALRKKAQSLLSGYFIEKVPGQIDDESIKLLKGAMRESECDRLWAMHNVPLSRIHHMRSKFYTGEHFNPLPSLEQDAKPMIALLENIQPDIVTVTMDPEGTGPDTHYKVLQVVAQSLKNWQYKKPVNVWGYRNVWYRFKYADANRFIPISQQDLQNIDNDFSKCFYTQKAAEFPSPYFDGRFSELSVKIQKEQKAHLKLLLGNDYFEKHPNAKVRQADGFLLFRDLPLSDFLQEARNLKSRIVLDEAFTIKG